MDKRFNKNNTGKNNYIGMEIDDYEVRVVEFDLTTSTPTLFNTGRIKLEVGTIVDGIVKNPAQLASKFRELWTQAALSSDKVLLGIGSQDILIRFSKIPKMEDSKIKNIIRFQSQDYFPVSIADYEMDFMTLCEKTDEDQREFKEIVIVASRNSHIKGYTQALEAAKLTPYEIDISALAIMKYGEQLEKDITTIIANIAYGKLDLLILKNSIPVFAKTSLFDSSSIFSDNSITSAETSISLDKPIEVSFENNFASAFSEIAGISPISLEIVSDISYVSEHNFSLPIAPENPLFLDISSEIKSLVNYCFSLSDSEPPSVIVLCGPCSRLEGLTEHISTQTMTKTIILDPFNGVFVPEDLRIELGNTTTDFSVCASLAIKGLEV